MKKLIINDREIGEYSASWRNKDGTVWFDMGDHAVVVSSIRINTLCWGEGTEPTVILVDC